MASSYVGSKIRVTADDGVYEGNVTAVDTGTGRITLGKVKSCTSNKRLSGIIHFFGKELSNIEILESQKDTAREVVAEDEYGPRLIGRRHETPSHLKRLHQVEWATIFPPKGNSSPADRGVKNGVSRPKSPLMMRRASFGTQSDSEPESDPCERLPVFNQPRPEAQPAVYTVLETVGDEFYRAMEHVKNQSVIGVAAEGVGMGRNGQLCWLQVATPKHVLLFDVLALEAELFEQGLADILEAASIQKVIHDCRLLSDQLFHQYHVKLVNVFDTQVADAIVYRMEFEGDLPRYVHGLSATLLNHVPDFPQGKLYIQHTRETMAKEDQSMWTERPASDVQLDAAAKNVVHLRKMRTLLLGKLLGDFVDGVDIYLGTVRDLSARQYGSMKVETHLLPAEFSNLRVQARESRSRARDRDNPMLYDQNGFRENCIGVKDPDMKFCHFGAWHKGDGKMQTCHSDDLLKRRGRTRDTHNRSRSRSRSGSRSRSRGGGREKVTLDDDPEGDSVVALGAASRRKGVHQDQPVRILQDEGQPPVTAGRSCQTVSDPQTSHTVSTPPALQPVSPHLSQGVSPSTNHLSARDSLQALERVDPPALQRMSPPAPQRISPPGPPAPQRISQPALQRMSPPGPPAPQRMSLPGPQRMSPTEPPGPHRSTQPVVSSGQFVLTAAGNEGIPCKGTQDQREQAQRSQRWYGLAPTEQLAPVLDNMDIIPSQHDMDATGPYLSRLPKYATSLSPATGPVSPVFMKGVKTRDIPAVLPNHSPAVQDQAPLAPAGRGRGNILTEALRASNIYSVGQDSSRAPPGGTGGQFSDSDTERTVGKGRSAILKKHSS